MAFDLFFWLFISFPFNVALLASAFYQVLMLSDLEGDYLNPYDASSRINYFVVPEFIGQGLLCALFLFTGHWFMFFFMLPLASYHVMLYVKRQHLLDVTEVFRVLNAEKKFRIAKLAFYLTMVIITIFRQRIRIHAAGSIKFYNSRFE
uniref:Protein cornichon homolog 1 isoform X1 n=1 Tax=Cicer arietinum TaxID=3827 RepID=A0A3Q7Y9K9_CICAR|nr:protein cornichon homolog 1 isoform X1 [Cicer arietinum]